MAVHLRCLALPCGNHAEGIEFSRPGEILAVRELTHYWEGQVARGFCEIVAAAEFEAQAAKMAKPPRRRKNRRKAKDR